MTAQLDLKSFPFYRQLDAMDCGPTCLQMVAKHYGKFYSLPYLRAKCYIDRAGVSLKGIAEAAETIGFRTLPVKVPFGKSAKNASLLAAPLPAIAHWKQNHFIVVYKVTRKYVWLADPGAGKFKLRRSEFEQSWLSDSDKGVLLLLQPSIEFNQTEGQSEDRTSLFYLFRYLKPHRKLVTQLILGLVIGSVLTLAFPFLTQAIVDVGIQNQNIGFIYLILFGQLALFAGQTFIRFIQNWILLHIGVRLNIGLKTKQKRTIQTTIRLTREIKIIH
ncbi:MAG: cysteine peptidase family C39 domain-containing protein [Bacteroidota bacterium]